MTDAGTAPTSDTCPRCGGSLITGTVDLAGTPAETADVDQPRIELQPGQMARSLVCTTPGCPGPDSGAVV